MTIRKEIALRDFEFWSGGADRANNCSAEELDTLEQFFEETEPEEGWTDTDINDMFWFEFDTLAQYLGYKNEEDFDMHHDPNYVDDDELAEYAGKWLCEFVTQHRDDYTLLEVIAEELGVGQTEDEWAMYEDEDSVDDYIIRCYENNESCFQETLMDDFFNEYDSGHETIDERIPSTMLLRQWAMAVKENNNKTLE